MLGEILIGLLVILAMFPTTYRIGLKAHDLIQSRLHPLRVRRAAFQAENGGSTPPGATTIPSFYYPIPTPAPTPKRNTMDPKTRSLYWRQKDGQYIKISEMNDDHIINCMLMVIRNHTKCRTVDKLNKSKIYQPLLKEAKSRGYEVLMRPKGVNRDGKTEYAEISLKTTSDDKTVVLNPELFPQPWESRVE